MKKLILSLAVITILFSCSSDSNSNSNNPSNGNVEYEFTITINGIVHKINGNTANGYNDGSSSSSANNSCRSWIQGNFHGIFLSISDITESNHVNGNDISCSISLPSTHLGIIDAQVLISGEAMNSFVTSSSASSQNFVVTNGTNNTNSLTYNAMVNRVPLNITDLGTETIETGGDTVFGNSIKGNFSGTVYLQPSGVVSHTIPLQLTIDFKAIRFY